MPGLSDVALVVATASSAASLPVSFCALRGLRTRLQIRPMWIHPTREGEELRLGVEVWNLGSTIEWVTVAGFQDGRGGMCVHVLPSSHPLSDSPDAGSRLLRVDPG